ncbi:MAG: V-type ATP synthase subunit I [Synergistaceae bacterium]|jgi:V/A-type H+-transporting ATPase subunit I|nr:V-type ATP synthase subunit I [Synergistaceae bacterium]
MAVAELKKAELYYHKSVQEDVARVLQRSGVCHIIEDSREERARQVDERLSACEEQETHIRYLFRALASRYNDPVPTLDRLLGDKPALSMAELVETARKTDLKELTASVKKMETALNELRLETSQLKTNAGILSKIADCPYPLNVFTEGTRTLKGVLGSLLIAQTATLAEDLRALAGETEFFTAAGNPKDKEAWVAILYARVREREVFEICAKNGMSLVELPPGLVGVTAEESAKMADRLAACERSEAELLNVLTRTADEWMPSIQKASDYWAIQHGRYGALAASGATESAVKTSFWVPVQALPALQKQLESVGPGVALYVSVPAKDDAPPTLLRNNAFVRPTDALTNLYSPPVYGELDPTPFLSPFFFIFFGMCLGDAGYALVIGTFLWLLFRKYRKIPSNLKNFINIFSIGAVTTFIYGAISGSFFGDSIDKFFFLAPLRGIKSSLFFLDPMGNPMSILALSLLIGVTHLMFGLGIAAYDDFRKGNYIDAVGDKISWILFVLGLILLGGGAAGFLSSPVYMLGKGMSLVGACLIFWYAGRGHKNVFMKIGAGLYALYGSTSYLGDILSYSRLLALGLGSAVIGSVINLLGAMAAEIPVVGFLLSIVIVVGGHAFGIAVNILGAFVHSMRLQYVEFFSKFYAGGGSIFTPLTLSTRYVRIADCQE